MGQEANAPEYAEHIYKRMNPSGVVRGVRCTCGHENEFYVWSWAAHSWAKCKKNAAVELIIEHCGLCR